MSNVIPIKGRGLFYAQPEVQEGTCEGCAFAEDGHGCLNAPDCKDVVYKKVPTADDYKTTHGGYPNA